MCQLLPSFTQSTVSASEADNLRFSQETLEPTTSCQRGQQKEFGSMMTMKIFVAGLSYKTTPVEVREKFAVHPSRLQCCGCRLKLRGNLSEVVLVSTCNRVEIYGVSPWIHGTVHRLFQELSNTDYDFTPHLYVKEGAEAVKHLFAVASGLDSMVLGETQITGQIKNAYFVAKEARLTGPIMNRLFQTAA
jgi:glutamyl-tRNA reductase